MIEAHIPAQLMDELEMKWPEQCPDPKDTDRHIWLYAGARQLVRALKTAFNKQQKDAVKKIL